jgi:phosphoglycolate phosphatase
MSGDSTGAKDRAEAWRGNAPALERALLCDLDGTLVDSAAGVLASLRCAFEECGVTPVHDLNDAVIGPPLATIIGSLCGPRDGAAMDSLIGAFRRSYDAEGCLNMRPYAGVDNALRKLAAAGTRLFIVTNKRAAPTTRILEGLSWSRLFEGVYCLDGSTGSRCKADLVGAVMAARRLNAAWTNLVGDSVDDAEAARRHGLRFMAASWGYGGSAIRELPYPVRWLQSAAELVEPCLSC